MANMERNCATCGYLDKAKKRKACGAYEYGCRSKKNDGYVGCWINSDSTLSSLACGRDWVPIGNGVQITIEQYLREKGDV